MRGKPRPQQTEGQLSRVYKEMIALPYFAISVRTFQEYFYIQYYIISLYFIFLNLRYDEFVLAEVENGLLI